MTTRDYTSPLRSRMKAETQAQILEAAVRVVLDDGIHAFTVGTVAERAGVAHRTVYRHYPTREALLEGLASVLEGTEVERQATVDTLLSNVDNAQAQLRLAYAWFDRHAEATRATVVASIALQHQLPDRQRRSRQVQAAVARRFPSAPKDVRRRAAHLMRTIGSSRYWYVLRTEEGLSGDEAIETACLSMRLIFEELEALDSSPKKRSTSP